MTSFLDWFRQAPPPGPRPDPRLADVLQEASKMLGGEETPDSDVCFGHALSTSRGMRIFRKNDTIEGCDGSSAIRSYWTMLRKFNETYNSLHMNFREASSGTSYTSANTITGHTTLFCTFRHPRHKKTFLWYYNPWGYRGESRYYSYRFRETVEGVDGGNLRARNEYGKYGEKVTKRLLPTGRVSLRAAKEITRMEVVDAMRMRDYAEDAPEMLDSITWNYIFNKILYTSPAYVEKEFNEIMARDFKNKQGIQMEVLVLLKIVYNRSDIHIIPNDLSMPFVGVQSQFGDGFENSSVFSKKVQVGACSIWSFLYSRVTEHVLSSVTSEAEALDVITNHLPNIFLMGEKDVKHLLGKIVLIHGIGAGIYGTLRKIYSILPHKNEDEEENRRYREMVCKRYDEALKKMYPRGDEESMMDRNFRKISPVFFPKRDSTRIPIVLDFLRQVTGDRIRPEDVQEIKDGIILGGYLTSSAWDLFLQIILIVISCKQAL